MKNVCGFISSLCVLLLVTLTSTLHAETLKSIARLTPETVVPPPAVPQTGLDVVVTTIIDINRDVSGNIIAATAYFLIDVTATESVEVTGCHLREGVENSNGPVLIDPGFSGIFGPPLPETTILGGESLDSGLLQRMLAKPYGFYFDIRTSANPDGALRGQLNKFTGAGAPAIQLTDTTFLATGSVTPTFVRLFVTDFDPHKFTEFDRNNGALINGLPAPYFASIITSIGNLATNIGDVVVGIPPEMRANEGKLSIQIRNSRGVLSTPSVIAVAPESKLNSTPVTTVDAGKFGKSVSPESIAAAFGDKLASQPVPAPSLPLPVELDGASVFVDGAPAGLFYVSPGQANFAVPSNTLLGSAQVMVVAKDGVVSRGKVKVTGTSPAIFTVRSDGSGAPAAIASRDGQNFDILLSSADGSPVPIDAGNFVALFGTGIRFSSTPVKINIGGVDIDPLYFGPQGSLEGTDQVNLRIPDSLAGRGDVDLILTLDAVTSNTVKLKIN